VQHIDFQLRNETTVFREYSYEYILRKFYMFAKHLAKPPFQTRASTVSAIQLAAVGCYTIKDIFAALGRFLIYNIDYAYFIFLFEANKESKVLIFS
jgi:hypothetical protein